MIASSRPHVDDQKSLIYTQAPQSVLEAGDALGGGWMGTELRNTDTIYEIRKYQVRRRAAYISVRVLTPCISANTTVCSLAWGTLPFPSSSTCSLRASRPS